MTVPPIGLLALLFCLLEPGFTFLLHRLEDQISFGPLFLGYFPLFIAVVATAIVLLVNWTVDTVSRKDSLSPKQKSSFRSEP